MTPIHESRKTYATPRTMRKVKLRPSKKFHALITLHGSLYAAVVKWDVPYSTMRDWLGRRAQLPGDTVARLVEVTHIPYDELFEHEKRKR